MDRLIYTALTGMRARTAAQAVTANNLANVSTTGFRRELSSLASQYLNGGNATARVQASDTMTTSLLDGGAIEPTGQPLDVAVQGAGWIAVQAADGSEAYTRRGDLRVSAAGLLETGDGHPVLGNGGAIAVPAALSVAIASDGSISIVTEGSPTPVVLDRIKLVDPLPSTLRRGDDTLFRTPTPADTASSVQLTPGALERANVSSAAELVDMLEAARSFETNVKLLTATRDIDEAGAKLMRYDS